MIVHDAIAAELVRQRHDHIARSVERCRRIAPARRRWWALDLSGHGANAHDGQATTPTARPATA